MKTIKRDFFREGDIVIDNKQNVYIYIKAVGLFGCIVENENGERIELMKDKTGTLHFAPDFDPGMIAEKYS